MGGQEDVLRRQDANPPIRQSQSIVNDSIIDRRCSVLIAYFPVTMKCPRRFCDQHASLSPVQNGASFPRLLTVMRFAGMPSEARYAWTALARFSPSARLYSSVPRSSAWPSTRMVVLDQRFSQSASVARAA